MKRIALLLALVMVVLVSGCSSTIANRPENRDYFKVGVITTLSGPEVVGGNLTRRGYDLWAETVNAKGGIKIGDKRYKVKLVYADDQCDPTVGAEAAERMITKENVDFVLGPYASSPTLAAAPIMDKYKVPMITGSAESPEIWKNHFKFTFGVIPAVDLTARAPIEILVKAGKPSPKTIAIIGLNDPFSKATAEAFKKCAEKLGLKVVKYSIVPTGTDFSPLISAIKVLNPDIIAVGAGAKDGMEVIKASKSLDYMPKALIIHWGAASTEFVTNLGKDAEYIFGSTTFSRTQNFKDELYGSTKNYIEIFNKKYGTLPDYTETASAVTGEIFAAALKKINAKPPLTEKQREDLVKAIEEVRINTVYGPVRFETHGNWYHNNTGLEPLALQIRGGKYVIVGPQDFKENDLIYPTPSWKSR